MSDIRDLINKMETINKVIVEGKSHLDHPEDLVLQQLKIHSPSLSSGTVILL